MQRLSQEFFWTPCELVDWVQSVVAHHDLWIVTWLVGGDAEIARADELDSRALHSEAEDAVHWFLGRRFASTEPRWSVSGHRRVLDFKGSYAVHVVPCLLAKNSDVLLQGRVAVMEPELYENVELAQRLRTLFGDLVSSLKKRSDSARHVVQRLPDGRTKVWKDILLSRSVPSQGLKLKQFLSGEVEFEIEAESGLPSSTTST
jgi:hypothetical protein